ncbi:MAG: DUF58 domain-containing protein, partial [Halioglobus sp.]|nr:DUF58 domain-containing protein [Halioglobus sp.]
GMEFDEVRVYHPGDDVRTIDWRVTARTGSAHTKLFREERERPVLIVVDQRNSMFFGSSHCFKSVLAAQLGSLLAWSALQAGDRVGGLVFDDHGHSEIRPKRSRRQVLALLSDVERFNHALPLASSASATPFADMLANLRRIARPGSSIFLISDFRAANTSEAREQWFELAKHTEITALACTDPLEMTLPREGTYAVTDGRQRSELNTGDRALRERFSRHVASQRDALSQYLLRLGIPLLSASTDSPPLGLLQTYYGERRR